MNLLSFIGASVLLTLMPGPDILFVITQSIIQGKKAGFVFAAGLCTGLIFHTTAVCVGLSVLIYSSPLAFTILKFAGASYLIYLGIKSFLNRRQSLVNPDGNGGVQGKLFRKGILMNILNPKVILFFLAFFPQFVDTDAGNPALQMALLGGVFMIQAMLIFSLVAFLADVLSRRLMQQPRFSFWMNIFQSVVYGIIGLSILFI